MDGQSFHRLRATLVIACLFGCHIAFAGSPPLITDDPETPGYHGWEINITSAYEQTHDGHEMEAPLFDINYGLFSDRDQLKVEFAVLQNDPNGAEAEWGISDLLIGYKYRFINEDETCTGWAVSFYPQIASPTGDEDRGLGSGQTELFFPFEFQKAFCDDKAWINPEIGYDVVLGDSDSNFWKFGLAMGYEYESGLELQGEVGAFVFPSDVEPDVPFFNLGFAYPLNKNLVLLGSAGRSFRAGHDGVPDFFCLFGVQVLLGAAADEENPAHEEGGGDEGGGDEMNDPTDEADFPYPNYMQHNHTAGSHHYIKPYLMNPAS
jgi:Putative MetA-pathway of phenol degradation